jgi:hypothetical protein
MTQLFFSSILNDSYYPELETLLFFNSHQEQFRSEIIQSVETYGSPTIVREDARLRIRVGQLSIVQSLFGFDSDRPDAALIGVILYFRESMEQLTILHIAVHPTYAATGVEVNQCLALRLLQQVRQVGSHLKGVHSVALLYGDARLRKIPVHHAVRQPALSH